MRRNRRPWARILAGPAAVLAIVGVAALLSAVGVGGSTAPSPVLTRATGMAKESVTPLPGTPTAITSVTTTPEVTAIPIPEPTPPAAPPPVRPPEDLLRHVSKTSESLPAEFVPPDLVPLPPGLSVPAGIRVRASVFEAFAAMAMAARAEGITLAVVSGYRSYVTQAAVYDEEVALYGKVQADRQVALPGRSEHQLGTAVDISLPRLGFALDDYLDTTPEGRWLEAHGWQYGFVISYPKGKEEITGYRFEPWHYRFVGLGVARYVHNSGLTLTEVLAAHPTVGNDPVTPPTPVRDPSACRGPLLGEGC